MNPSAQRSKDRQDEARREQQADERIRELEQEVGRLRGALATIATFTYWATDDYGAIDAAQDMKEIAQDALDGGGGADDA